jgi:hypothetical protein
LIGAEEKRGVGVGANLAMLPNNILSCISAGDAKQQGNVFIYREQLDGSWGDA